MFSIEVGDGPVIFYLDCAFNPVGRGVLAIRLFLGQQGYTTEISAYNVRVRQMDEPAGRVAIRQMRPRSAG